jgi:hypothetical protein
MKTLWKIIGSVLLCSVLLLVVLRITGCNPGFHKPGLWLTGNLVTAPVTDWSFVNNYEFIAIQTRTRYLLPHSVNTGYIVLNGQLYVYSGYPEGVEWPHDRVWNENVAQDPHVRLKIGNQLFDRTLFHVTDPVEKTAFLAALTERRKRMAEKYGTSTREQRFEVLRVVPD